MRLRREIARDERAEQDDVDERQEGEEADYDRLLDEHDKRPREGLKEVDMVWDVLGFVLERGEVARVASALADGCAGDGELLVFDEFRLEPTTNLQLSIRAESAGTSRAAREM